MLDELSRKLGYEFNDKKLLKIALTHRSSDENNNERLEFLGDSIVNFLVAEILYMKFPNAHEGHLSRWRATLINREALGNLAKQLDLGRFLILGPGELKSGGVHRHSILSCAMEAIIGAIYLDAGFETTLECVKRWFEPMIASISFSTSHKDPKTRLQEYLQAKHLPLPNYSVETITGESHEQTFTVILKIESLNQSANGVGTSRRKAEQDAANKMLGILKNE